MPGVGIAGQRGVVDALALERIGDRPLALRQAAVLPAESPGIEFGRLEVAQTPSSGGAM